MSTSHSVPTHFTYMYIYIHKYIYNNNNIYELQMNRHPVAVVNLHITYARTTKVDYSKFGLGGYMGSIRVYMYIDVFVFVLAMLWKLT
jgi:hypothetical protein